MYNELIGPISTSLHPGNTAPFEEILQVIVSRWQHCVGFKRP